MIELATAKDRTAVNRLAWQVQELHVAWRPDIFRSVEELYTEERFMSLIRARQLYVAKLDGVVVGYALTGIRDYNIPPRHPAKVFLIDELCVDGSLRNRGIGTRMMEEIRVLARAFGCTDLQLGVYPQNDAAVSFYQKCGFMIRSIDMQRKV